MSWETWVILGWFALNAALNIVLVGRPRPAVTGGAALFSLCVYVVLAWIVIRGMS
jgi:hypothetical protein